MAKLESGIGIEQRKHTSLRTKAGHYRRMAEAIRTRDDRTIASFPKNVPRGKSPDWYVERAEQYEQQSATAGEMASLLHDMEWRNHLEAMTPQDVWEDLVEGHGFPEMTWRHPGWLAFLAEMMHRKMEDLPYLVPKLSPMQRHQCQQFIRMQMEALIAAFDGQGPKER